MKNFLIDTGVLSRSQIDAALREREGKPFVQAVVESGIISEDELRRASARRLGVPFVILNRGDISIESLVLIPEPLSRTANIVAYRHGEDGIEVALLDLADLEHIDFLRQTHRVNVRLTDRGSIKQALLLYQKHLKEKFAGMVQSGKQGAEALLKHALHSGAHYVHLEPLHAEAAGIVVRYRIEGMLREAMRLPEEASRYIVEQLKSLAKLFPVSSTVQEGSFMFTHNGKESRIAVTSVPTAYGEKLSMRLTGFSLQSLGLHGQALEQVHAVLHKRKGAVVVAGMSSSGKTTMLYTLLDHVTGAHAAAATVEESIEHRLPRVHQTMTRPDLGLTVAAALRGVLRQDPDVVMVSDLEGVGTAELALSAASRGIFILGGLQARSAEGALEVLRSECDVGQQDIDKNVKLVMALRLMRRLRMQAARTRMLARSEAELLEGKVRFAKVLAALKEESIVHEHTAWKDIQFYTGAGQDSPDAKVGASYSGSVGIQEISQHGQPASLTLLEDALFKSVQGLVSIEDVVEMARE